MKMNFGGGLRLKRLETISMSNTVLILPSSTGSRYNGGSSMKDIFIWVANFTTPNRSPIVSVIVATCITNIFKTIYIVVRLYSSVTNTYITLYLATLKNI